MSNGTDMARMLLDDVIPYVDNDPAAVPYLHVELYDSDGDTLGTHTCILRLVSDLLNDQDMIDLLVEDEGRMEARPVDISDFSSFSLIVS